MKKLNLTIFIAALIFVFGTVNLSAQKRISFQRGKTSTTLSGALGARGAKNSTAKFVVSAKAGQHLSVVVKSPNRNVYTNILSETGERGADFYYTLDADGDTIFIVENVGARWVKFTITVSIK